MKNTIEFPLFVMYVDSKDPELLNWYLAQVERHNKHVREDPCPNSGFDLATPLDTVLGPSIYSNKVVTQVKGMMIAPHSNDRCMGYYMFPRSSISKTPLVLSNHVGIIDSGYRGPLTGAFRNLDTVPFTMKKFDRYLQVCTGTLEPFLIRMVEDEADLGITSRGQGGFGSTGR
jgi:dUTPase